MIDFNKPLICSNPDVEILNAFLVKYPNAEYTHAVHVRNKVSGKETVGAAGPFRIVIHHDGEMLTISNPAPKIVKEHWTNLYKNDIVGIPRSDRQAADLSANGNGTRGHILHSVFYDNGDVKRWLIKP